MYRAIKFFTLLTILFLSACGMPANLLAEATATISLSPIPMIMESATPTVTLTPTPTIYVTNTPTPTATPDYSPTPAPATLEAIATLDTLMVLNPALKPLYQENKTRQGRDDSAPFGLSPNGAWAIFSTTEGAGEGLKIVRVDGQKEWAVDYGSLAEASCPCPQSSVRIEHWSLDGRYIYLAPVTGEASISRDFWRASQKLFRLNLENGSWKDTRLGPGHVFSPKMIM